MAQHHLPQRYARKSEKIAVQRSGGRGKNKNTKHKKNVLAHFFSGEVPTFWAENAGKNVLFPTIPSSPGVLKGQWTIWQ
jgi:hypothetical protein